MSDAIVGTNHRGHILAGFLSLVIASACSLATPAAETVTIDTDAPVCANFLGFGAEWDPKFWTMGTFDFLHDVSEPVAVTEADWDLVRKRMHWMRIKLVRMMMLTGWCTSGDGTFTWDNAHMRSLYRHLDLCREEHIQVILTDWGMAKWPKVPGFTGTDDPRYAHAIGEYLDELVVKRRYDCIRSFILVNEPNAEAESFERWRDGVRATAAELARRKLDQRIRFLGSDDYDPPYVWHARAISELSDVFGGFDVHRYETQETVRSGGLEAALRTVAQASRAKDPAKPFLICEAGMSDRMTTSGSPFINDPVYGLFMADYAVQACRAGCDSMLPWMLDDGSHAGFTWGMWTSKAEGMVLKPWFWTWSLLCRYVPPGSMVFAPAQPEGMRVLAARHQAQWTVVVVNRRAAAAEVRVVVPGAREQSFQRYVYAGAVHAADADGFPVPTGDGAKADAGDGVLLTCPPESAIIATSME